MVSFRSRCSPPSRSSKERSPVEADLTKRATEALKKGGFTWASVRFDGRDAFISGKAIDETHPTRAVQTVYDLWGVRNAYSSIGLIDKIDKYEWLAVLRNKELQLGGYVPNDKIRRDILGSARAVFPGHKVDDKMQYGRTDIPLDAWFGGVAFALKQLAQMKQGEAKLERTSLTVSGEANTVAMYRGLRTALEKGMPKGINLKQEAVRPPVVKPYQWHAKHDGRQITLTGFVPNERARSEILGDVKRAFPKESVTDRMEPGDGAPANFQSAVRGLLVLLARLEEGEADIKDSVVTVTGLAEGIERANEVRGALRQAVGPSYRVAEQIKHREPVVANISPYTTSITIGRGVVVLRGHAPSDDARRAVGGQVQKRFAPKPIANQLDIGSGEPPGWQRCIDMAVVALHRLGNGKAELIDRTPDADGRDRGRGSGPVAGRCRARGRRRRVRRGCAGDAQSREQAEGGGGGAPQGGSRGRSARRRANLDREAALRARPRRAARRRKRRAHGRPRSARKQATVCVDGLRQLARDGVLAVRAGQLGHLGHELSDAQSHCRGGQPVPGGADRNPGPHRHGRRGRSQPAAVAAAGAGGGRVSGAGWCGGEPDVGGRLRPGPTGGAQRYS